MRPRRAVLLLSLATALVLPPSAVGDGLPVGGVDASRQGLPDGSGFRYVTFAALEGTVVARIDARDGTVDDWFQTRGNFTIPVVAYDGSPSGLSADGGTLVLIKPRAGFPRRSTSLYVIDTHGRLRPEGTITLKGDFSFDAISPDGRTMYLIHYLSPRDLTRYEVRAFDLESERLLPGPIVDPDEPGEQMAGLPMSRATSPDGRWEYTLYDGGGHEPFIHALDTVGGIAHCIDLPQLEGRNDLSLMRFDVDPSGGPITVLDREAGHPRSSPVLRVDSETFAVTSRPARDGSGDSGAGLPAWWLIAASVAGLLVALLLAGGLPRRRRRGQDLPDPVPVLDEDPDPEELASSRWR
jgi:hypothetical protein